MSRTPRAHHLRQSGGALLVAMVMIFMLSIMGISAMRGSSLERRMTLNSIQSSTVFQTAESATEAVIDDDQNLFLATASEGTAVPVDVAAIGDAALGIAIDATIEHTGTGLAPGSSIGSGSFKGFRYLVRAEASAAAIGATSEVEQGVMRLAPN